MATTETRQLAEQRVLDRLVRLWEDYAVRQLFPEAEAELPATQFTPTFLIDLCQPGVLRGAVLTTGADGKFRREAVQFEGITVAPGLTDARERVELAVFKRQNQQRWKLGTRRYVADLPHDDYNVVGNILEYIQSAETDFAELFEPVALRVAQALDREPTVEQVQWVVQDELLMFKLRTLRARFATRTRTWSALTDGTRVSALLLDAHVGQTPAEDIRGFVFCDSPAHLPQLNEQFLLLPDAQSGALFTWQTGRFGVTPLAGQDRCDLRQVKRIGYVGAARNGDHKARNEDLVAFASAEMIQDLALAHYLMWRPALAPWEIAVRRRKLIELHAAVAAQERENRELTALLERMKRVARELEHRSS